MNDNHFTHENEGKMNKQESLTFLLDNVDIIQEGDNKAATHGIYSIDDNSSKKCLTFLGKTNKGTARFKLHEKRFNSKKVVRKI